MPRVVPYIRVSTEDQNHGLTAQRDALGTYMLQKGWQPYRWYEERVSGAADLHNRPVLIDALAALDEGGVLLVTRRDRVARNAVTSALIEKLVRSRGGTLVSIDTASFGDGAEGQLVKAIMDAFADFERTLISIRTTAALRAKSQRGERIGTYPYGWEEDPEKPGHMRPSLKEQQIIALIRRYRAEGRSIREIVWDLERDGYTNRNGNRFHIASIERIMHGGSRILAIRRAARRHVKAEKAVMAEIQAKAKAKAKAKAAAKQAAKGLPAPEEKAVMKRVTKKLLNEEAARARLTMAMAAGKRPVGRPRKVPLEPLVPSL